MIGRNTFYRAAYVVLVIIILISLTPVSALSGYSYYQTINYAATDQATYQQDVVIHRTTGTAYQETVDGLKVWHIYVGDHCQADYGDIRFTKSDGTTELKYYRHPGYTSSQARFTVILENANQAGVLQIFYGHSGATTTSLTTHPKMVYTTATVDVHNEHDWSPTHGDNLSVAWNPNKATYISMWWNNDDVNLNPEAFLESLTTAIQEHTHGLGIMIILFAVFFFLAVAYGDYAVALVMLVLALPSITPNLIPFDFQIPLVILVGILAADVIYRTIKVVLQM